MYEISIAIGMVAGIAGFVAGWLIGIGDRIGSARELRQACLALDAENQGLAQKLAAAKIKLARMTSGLKQYRARGNA